MSIHPDAERVFFSKNPDMLPLARIFAPIGEITRAFTRTLGADVLHCFYIRLNQQISELIGAERELLIAYASFQEFQARSLKVHDTVLHEDRVRLDPVGSILVCDDLNTTKRVHEIISGEPERTPIVALSRQDVESLKDLQCWRKVLIEQLFRRDLFGLESPLRTETTFVGRGELVTDLVDRVRNGQNSGLFGLRRIGKTTVLFAVIRRSCDANIAHHAFLDLSSPAFYKLRWWRLLQELVKELSKPFELERAARSRIRALNIEYQESDGAGHFREDITTLMSYASSHRLLLLLDEIEHITFRVSPSEHWEKDFLPFWQTMRSVHQGTQGAFVFIIAGVNPFALETDRIEGFDNPLFSTVKGIFVTPFEYNYTRELVRKISKYMGIKCEEEVFHLLHSEYGGHPYLIRQACSEIAKAVKARPGALTLKILNERRPAVNILLEKNVKQILNVLLVWYPDEYEMIRMLAQNEMDAFLEFARNSAAFTQHVEGYGLVSSAQQSPQIIIGIVKAYLAKQQKKTIPAIAKSTDFEAVIVEVAKRRNLIELKLRELVRTGLLFKYGKKAMTSLLACIPEERRAILNQYAYDIVWRELFLKELMCILDRNYDAFQTRFSIEKAQVILWLEHVNKCRADAHAKTLSEEDLAFLRVCFLRLEEILN